MTTTPDAGDLLYSCGIAYRQLLFFGSTHHHTTRSPTSHLPAATHFLSFVLLQAPTHSHAPACPPTPTPIPTMAPTPPRPRSLHTVTHTHTPTPSRSRSQLLSVYSNCSGAVGGCVVGNDDFITCGVDGKHSQVQFCPEEGI
jgi:hypothetical protein